MRHATRFATLLAALAFATPAFAQTTTFNAPSLSVTDSAQVAPDSSSQVRSEAAPSGAALTGLRAGVHSRETARPNQPTRAAASQHMGQDRAMMIVGVAALVTGAIIGGTPGTIVMVGGGVIGLIGLYNYLQ